MINGWEKYIVTMLPCRNYFRHEAIELVIEHEMTLPVVLDILRITGSNLK